MSLLEPPLKLRLFWNSDIEQCSRGCFFSGVADKTLILKHVISYFELVQKICDWRGLDMSRVRIRITMRQPDIFGPTLHFSMVGISDDDDMQHLWDHASSFRGQGIELRVVAETVENNLPEDMPDFGPVESYATLLNAMSPENAPEHAIDPGPIRDDLLTLQQSHRSTYIWSGQIGDTPLSVCRSDSGFWRSRPFDPRVVELMGRAGFGGLLHLPYMKIDHALITALVERWRQETHTFHLTVGEATVTLQDVEVLLGLRIDGDPIMMRQYSHTLAEWQDICQDLLGFRPTTEDLDGSRMKLSSLEGPLSQPLTDFATPQMIAQHARCRILHLLGGCLFADKSRNRFHLRYLLFLRDLDASGTLSWGSAVLAYLYRRLCAATLSTTQVIAGPLLLLQLWAWERIPTMRLERVHANVQIDQHAPYGARWEGPLEFFPISSHVLTVYRDQLDSMRPEHFVWLPYTEQTLQALPLFCTHGCSVWLSVTSLFCWEMIELHRPDRVVRQFGFTQTIPTMVDTSTELHSRDLRSVNQKSDQIGEYHLSQWARRHDTVYQGVLASDVGCMTEDYSKWYWLHTRRFISNSILFQTHLAGSQAVGGQVDILADALQRILYIGNETSQASDMLVSQHALQTIVDICTRALSTMGEQCHLGRAPYEPILQLLVSQPVHPMRRHLQRERQVVRRGGRCARQNVIVVEPIAAEPSAEPPTQEHVEEPTAPEHVDKPTAPEPVEEQVARKIGEEIGKSDVPQDAPAEDMALDDATMPSQLVYGTHCASSNDFDSTADTSNLVRDVFETTATRDIKSFQTQAEVSDPLLVQLGPSRDICVPHRPRRRRRKTAHDPSPKVARPSHVPEGTT